MFAHSVISRHKITEHGSILSDVFELFFLHQPWFYIKSHNMVLLWSTYFWACLFAPCMILHKVMQCGSTLINVLSSLFFLHPTWFDIKPPNLVLFQPTYFWACLFAPCMIMHKTTQHDFTCFCMFSKNIYIFFVLLSHTNFKPKTSQQRTRIPTIKMIFLHITNNSVTFYLP
jgi:hypothetical protein